MATEKVDVIIFGATGFTGKCVVEELIRFNKNQYTSNENQYTWAVAGRHSNKLQDLLDWASLRTGDDVSRITTIVADVEDEKSLNTMASRGRVIINCVGPYRRYGEPVVKACINNGAHHLDVSGEPEYMESIQLNYNEAAKKKEVYVISACGFDSVPADFGVLHLIKNFGGLVNSVESYLACSNKSSEPAANIGTWESVVHAAATGNTNLKAIRIQLFASLNRLRLEPRLKPRWYLHQSPLFNNRLSTWFPGSDKTVVLRTQQSLYNLYEERPVQYRPYFICSPFPVLLGLMIVGFFLAILSKFNYGKRLLLLYPEFFSMGIMSSKGPSKEARASTFARFRFQGEGWSQDIVDKFENQEQINMPPNKRIVTEISFPDFGYGFTAKSIILSAVTILKESDQMPSKGGVFTPGAAFARTSFLDSLPKIGVAFKILPNK